jgi:hypothetical protein
MCEAREHLNTGRDELRREIFEWIKMLNPAETMDG